MLQQRHFPFTKHCKSVKLPWTHGGICIADICNFLQGQDLFSPKFYTPKNNWNTQKNILLKKVNVYIFCLQTWSACEIVCNVKHFLQVLKSGEDSSVFSVPAFICTVLYVVDKSQWPVMFSLPIAEKFKMWQSLTQLIFSSTTFSVRSTNVPSYA